MNWSCRPFGASYATFNSCPHTYAWGYYLPPLRGFLSVMLSPSGRVCVPRIFRWFFVKDKKTFIGALEQLAATPNLRRVIMSHGKMLEDQPGESLKTALTAF